MASDGVDFTIVENRLGLTRLSLAELRELGHQALRVVSAKGVADIFSLLLLLTRDAAEVISEDADFILWDRVCRALSAGEESKRFDVLNAWANILSQWALCSATSDLARLRREEAMRHYEEVLGSKSASPRQKAQALSNRGVTYGRLDDPKNAIADFTAVIQMPDAPTAQKAEALFNRGVAYAKLDDREKAMADFTAVIQMPDAPPEQKAMALSNRGWAYFTANRYREAIDDEQRAVTLDPKNCAARGNLAIALLVDGQTSNALPAYDSALAIADVEDVEGMATDLNDALRKQGTLPGVKEALARLEARRAVLAGNGVGSGAQQRS